MAITRLAIDDRPEQNVELISRLILERFPGAELKVYEGEDPPGIYIDARASMEDEWEMIEVVAGPTTDILIRGEAPIYVIPLLKEPVGEA